MDAKIATLRTSHAAGRFAFVARVPAGRRLEFGGIGARNPAVHYNPWEVKMPRVSRRTAIAVGLTVAAASAVPIQAKAAMYGPDEGEAMEGMEGIRRIALSERATEISGFTTVRLLDLVFQPGAKFPESPMEPMICHMMEGELQIANNGEPFTAKKNDVWTCNAGGTEAAENTTGEPAVMRVAQLIA